MQFHPSALDPAHIQNIVNQFEQMIAGIQDLAQGITDTFRIFNMVERNTGKAQDRVHGRADIVGHIGQEKALCVVCVPSPLQSILQKMPLLLFAFKFLLDTGITYDYILELPVDFSYPHDLASVIKRQMTGPGTECKGKRFLSLHVPADDIRLQIMNVHIHVRLIDS